MSPIRELMVCLLGILLGLYGEMKYLPFSNKF